jgi:hypothetical protein
MLFLAVSDQKETEQKARARALGVPFALAIAPPYR